MFLLFAFLAGLLHSPGWMVFWLFLAAVGEGYKSPWLFLPAGIALAGSPMGAAVVLAGICMAEKHRARPTPPAMAGALVDK